MASSPQSATPGRQLDWRLILGVPLRQFVWWLAAVVVVSLAGYPGVVCVTPMAWLLALRVGLLCASNSASPERGQRLQEAALAGAWLGLLEGVLFVIGIARIGDIQPSEVAGAVALGAIMVLVGIAVGAGMAVFSAYGVERRRAAAAAMGR